MKFKDLQSGEVFQFDEEGPLHNTRWIIFFCERMTYLLELVPGLGRAEEQGLELMFADLRDDRFTKVVPQGRDVIDVISEFRVTPLLIGLSERRSEAPAPKPAPDRSEQGSEDS